MHLSHIEVQRTSVTMVAARAGICYVRLETIRILGGKLLLGLLQSGQKRYALDAMKTMRKDWPNRLGQKRPAKKLPDCP